ncbi:hypothetical protein A2U01_0099473, partial [Trifolium medium]|nr:hypothetical protein [Trifolium medium]
SELDNPVLQPSVGEKSVVIPSSSCNAGHKESQPSAAHNLNAGAAEGCEVESDAAADDVDQRLDFQNRSVHR